jgi:hypothetical protein
MPGPRLSILGVYKPDIPQKTWRKQWQVTADDQRTQKHFAGLVLIEATVFGQDGKFNFGEFGQWHTDLAPFPDQMQVGYDEALLSADGTELIERKMGCVNGTGILRFAVYLHFYDPAVPVKWQFGEVQCPPVEPAPSRLMRLVPYRACS